ncbi:hypothetical protein K437DRAFT_171223 [Tilletiaria anomala UBC 951]|uniref:Uncharacterized protein n=1 Tax=Tilletiaria anomala (strain ATCC 24038 / CBS 436.72 / UBC 951) TaxID=1037660 RepID=A0A066VN10_TILAU|nr:uncharacterized protein K437DRAFT_171223 [Tilletiaria anomala UBC 951]KDN41678.1 hypothetical protein K437DRAFT_171223 [Tilletiaria anomala UBC 951]
MPRIGCGLVPLQGCVTGVGVWERARMIGGECVRVGMYAECAMRNNRSLIPSCKLRAFRSFNLKSRTMEACLHGERRMWKMTYRMITESTKAGQKIGRRWMPLPLPKFPSQMHPVCSRRSRALLPGWIPVTSHVVGSFASREAAPCYHSRSSRTRHQSASESARIHSSRSDLRPPRPPLLCRIH